MAHPRKSSIPKSRWRRYYPLLAILAMALAALACINTEITLKVTNNEDGTDNLVATFEQYLTDSFIAAAKEVNQTRKNDFAAAGRETDTENLLPVTLAEAGELFNPQKYQDQGYTVTTTDTGFKATKQFWLLDLEVSEDWQVRVITDDSGNIFYQAKVWLDLSELEGEDLFELRTQPDIDRPDLTPGAYDTEATGDPLGDLFGVVGDMKAEAEQEMLIELYYVQQALKKSNPLEYRIIVELPGHITTHDLAGVESGSVGGNQVTLVLSEADIAEHAGKKIEFLVESKLKDCSRACQSAPHLMWDGKEEGEDCNCVCEAGMTLVEGTDSCTHCDIICGWSDPNLVRDMEKCEINKCACQCKEGMEMNKAGTECIDEYDAWVEDQQRSEQGGPSPQELGDLFAALLDPPEDKNINKMPGWFLLNTKERERLLAYIEDLGLAVDRTRLIIDIPGLTTQQRIDRKKFAEANFIKARELVIFDKQMELQRYKNIQKWIIKEIGGKYFLGGFLAKIPDYLLTLEGSFRQMAIKIVDKEITDTVKSDLQTRFVGPEPLTVPEAAVILAGKLPELATGPCVGDYLFYEKIFKDHCGENCSKDNAEIAHEIALKKLREVIKPGRLNWAKEGNVYDRAFRHINSSMTGLEE